MSINWEPNTRSSEMHFGFWKYPFAIAAGIVISFVYVFGR
jgi:hypothetical protein